MLNGMVPFKGRGLEELRDAIVTSKLRWPEEEVKLSREAKHLIRLMLRKDPKQRASV